MAEWSKASVLKTEVRETAPWVRIPLPPHKQITLGASCLVLFVYSRTVVWDSKPTQAREAKKLEWPASEENCFDVS